MRQGLARQARHVGARCGEAVLGQLRWVQIRHGMAGMVRSVRERLGAVRSGLVRNGRQVMVRSVQVLYVEAWRGKVRFLYLKTV